jgi:hypothetical protein
MSIATTCSKQQQPSLRMVLLKGYDTRGFSFYTNYNSRKGQELAENGRAALCFFWEPLQRSVGVGVLPVVAGSGGVLSVQLAHWHVGGGAGGTWSQLCTTCPAPAGC